MKKNIILLGMLLLSGLAFSQVGINTDTPKSTLDVVGKAADTNSLDGITAPRLTGDQLRAKTYTTEQTGTLVYVTVADSAPAGQTIDVTATGYYYFNGTKWVSTGSGLANDTNIYNSDGSLIGPGNSRTLTLNGKTLNFVGAARKTYWDIDGRIHQQAADTSIDAAMGFHNGSANLWIQQWNSGSEITASNSSTGLGLSTHYTNDSAPITLSTSPGGNTTGVERMRITGEGNVGVDTPDPTERFDNAGITRLRNLPTNGATNAINTTSTGDMSAAQDQTFTATRTVVADDNGVLGTVAGLPATPVNIYNANGTLTSNRTLTQAGRTLTFLGTNQSTTFYPNNGLSQTGIAGNKRASIVLTANDNNSDGVSSNMQLFQDPEGIAQITTGGDSRGINIGPTQTTLPAYLAFTTSAGGSSVLGTEKMRITPTGNVGINTISPTEKLDNNGITRLRNLPANGTANAINTTSGGTASGSQDQTFTATRTVVADANGVLGYVNGLPTGTSKIILSAAAVGNQNIGNANMLLANYPTEYIDVYSAYASNVFTVPPGMGGIYSFSMQSAHSHDVNAQTSWFVSALLQKSTNGGSTYSLLMKDTNANMNGSTVDNGNSINWTGTLNAGDKIRLLYHSDSSASNYVNLGSITITQIAQ
ncbi:hypothetical protein [Epilithonimonas sp.]|uniref:hypothetical protein n=1 Tax=Epilithonimonas sp. TaxID=2894511 RepID=UPI00289DC426|nr:hypothetical protein [Epilithonimonas sp.]